MGTRTTTEPGTFGARVQIRPPSRRAVMFGVQIEIDEKINGVSGVVTGGVNAATARMRADDIAVRITRVAPTRSRTKPGANVRNNNNNNNSDKVTRTVCAPRGYRPAGEGAFESYTR